MNYYIIKNAKSFHKTKKVWDKENGDDTSVTNFGYGLMHGWQIERKTFKSWLMENQLMHSYFYFPLPIAAATTNDDHRIDKYQTLDL